MLSFAAFLAGLALCLGLIISIGAQNAYLLRQGIRREHVGAIVIACIASEVVLQTAGVAGVGLLVQHVPWLEPVARWVGALVADQPADLAVGEVEIRPARLPNPQVAGMARLQHV